MSSISFGMMLMVLAAPGSKSGAQGGDWPQWRGPNRDAVSTETGLLKKWPEDGPKRVWTCENAGVGYGSPSIAAGRVFLLGSEDPEKGNDEFMLCLGESDGKEKWRTALGTGKGDYLFGWGTGPRSSPTVEGDFVYCLGAKGDLLCLNVADGKKVWTKNLVKDFGGRIPQWGYSESVLIDGENLICTPGGSKGSVLAVKKKSGEEVWRSTDITDGAAYSSLVLCEAAGVRSYVQQTMAHVCGIRATDGKLLWQRADIGYRVAVIPTPVVYKDNVFVTSGYGAGCSLIKLSKDGDDGIKAEKVYANKSVANHHGGVLRVGEYIYGHSDSGGWICLEFLNTSKAEGPEPIWKSSKLDKGSVTYADGNLYCYGQGKGVCALVKANPDKWDEVSRFEIPQKSTFPRKSGLIWAHPVVANGKLYLRDHEILMSFNIKE